MGQSSSGPRSLEKIIEVGRNRATMPPMGPTHHFRFLRDRRARSRCAALPATGNAHPAAQARVAAARAPNIVWISNEDMSPRLGAYGDAVARTPVLDRLAQESVRYTRAFTTAPVCAPSRAAIITGMYQTAIGAQHMRTTEDRVPELPGPVPRGSAVLRQSVSRSTCAPPATTRPIAPRPTTSSACRSRSGTTRAGRRTGGTVPDKSQPFFSVFNLEVTHESQIFPSSPARKGKPLVTDPGEARRCRRTTRTRRSSARSWRACTTTSPTWTRRSARS